MLQFLPWELKAFIYLCAGLLVAVLTLAIPKRWLVKIGQLPFLSPNWISIWHFVFFWIGVDVLFTVNASIGYLIIVFACCLDVIDGKMATAMAEAGIVRSKFDLWIGTWIDPLFDKGTLDPLIGIVSFLGFIHPVAALFIIFFDVIGTFLRDPFNAWERLRRWIYDQEPLPWNPYQAHLELKRAAGPSETKANPIGKIKSLLQSLGLVLCGPYLLHWIEPDSYATYWFSVTAAFGFMSVTSRHLNIVTLRRVLKRLQKSHFDHEDV